MREKGLTTEKDVLPPFDGWKPPTWEAFQLFDPGGKAVDSDGELPSVIARTWRLSLTVDLRVPLRLFR